MKLRSGRFALVTCCFITATVLLAAQPAPATPETGTVTVGDFVVRLADALSPGHQGIKTLDQAKVFFARQGIVLSPNLNMSAPLTQMDVKTVTAALGVDVTAQQPGKAFNKQATEGLIGYLRDGFENGRIAMNPPAGRRTDSTTLTSPALSMNAPTPKGECCINTGTNVDCVFETAAQCSADGGSYQGDGGSCDPNPCAQNSSGTGACCVAGACSQQTNSQCVASGGIYKGKDIPCSPDPCDPSMAQCCIALHNCTITTLSDCTAQGGIWTGKDSCFPPGNACRNAQPVTPTEP